MSEFVDHLDRGLSKLERRPKRLLVAVSGGADSVALLRGLVELREEWDLEVQAAHFNHRTRGEASDEDQRWVEALCSSLGVNCHAGQRPEESSQPAGDWSENDLRKMRLSFLDQTAQACQISLVCLGHHQQDQVETLLHHLLRGTSLRGLSGIPEMRWLSSCVQVYRPLLGVSRFEILEYLQNIGQDFRHDTSNDSLDYTRNRIRHELLPLIEQIRPQAPLQLLRLQQQASETQEFHQYLVADLLEKSIVQQGSDVVRLRKEPLKQSHRVLVRELFVTLWTRQNWPRGSMGQREWERLREFVHFDGPRIELPGKVAAIQRGDLIVLERKEKSTDAAVCERHQAPRRPN